MTAANGHFEDVEARAMIGALEGRVDRIEEEHPVALGQVMAELGRVRAILEPMAARVARLDRERELDREDVRDLKASIRPKLASLTNEVEGVQDDITEVTDRVAKMSDKELRSRERMRQKHAFRMKLLAIGGPIVLAIVTGLVSYLGGHSQGRKHNAETHQK